MDLSDGHDGESGMGNRRVSAIVLVLVAGFVLAIVVPAINDARLTARRVGSRNHLKQLALAFHNHNDVYNRLPSGATLSGDGEALHGWYTQTLPYLAASAMPSRIHHDLPWRHRLNQYNFLCDFFDHKIPGVTEHGFTDAGYGTLHYPGNPRAFHVGSKTRFSDIEGDRTNCWLLGEALPPYAPWGYPFNWRSLSHPIGQPGGFGSPWSGTQFAMADGSVRRFDAEVAGEILRSMNGSLPSPQATLVRVPERQFSYGERPKFESLDLSPGDDQGVAFCVHVNRNGDAVSAWRVHKTKAIGRGIEPRDLLGLRERYPEVRELFDVSISDETIDSLNEFRNLEVLSGDRRGASGMQNLKPLRLELLHVRSIDISQEALQTELPSVEIVVTK